MILVDGVRSGSDTPVVISNIELQNDDGTTTLGNPSNCTVFLSVQDVNGTWVAVQIEANPQTESVIMPPSSWVGHIPALALVFSASPWRFVIQVFGPNGVNDVLLGTESQTVMDLNR